MSDFQKGLLTVKIIQAKALSASTNVVGTTNPYVEMMLVDCDKLRWGGRAVGGGLFAEKGGKPSCLLQVLQLQLMASSPSNDQCDQPLT